MLFLLLIFFIFLSKNEACPNGSIPSYTDNTKCYFLNYTKTDFIDAEGSCIGLGGHLTSIHDMFEKINFRTITLSMFLMIFIDLKKALSNFTDSTSGDFWIGANDLVMSGNWSWTDKTSFDFNDWDKGQPQNVSDCGAVVMAHGKWITDDCIKQKSFICLVSSISTTPAASTLPVTTTMKSTSCPPSWTYYNITGFCYMPFPNGTWLYGEDRCRVENATLASVHSPEEAHFLADLAYYQTNDPCDWTHQAWFGLYTDDNNLHWRWTDGTPFNYSNWHPGEPDGPGSQNCALIKLFACPQKSVKPGEFENAFCKTSIARFICKKAPA